MADREAKGPCHVIDGNGNEIRWVRQLNTETGEAIVLKRLPDGRFDIDHERGAVKEMLVTIPRPILVHWLMSDERQLLNGKPNG